METYLSLSILAVGFAVIALASQQVGAFFVKLKLPLISGFLFMGIIAGPFVLGFIPASAVENLRFVDEVALAFIAFAAGSELYLKELRSRLNSIKWVTIGQILSTFSLGSLAVFFLANLIPFMRNMPVASQIAVSLLAGAILVARSPSSVIAIINELRAKGPFTQTVLGVTVVKDIIVIILFAMSSSMADTLLKNLGFDLSFMILLLAELLLSFVLGYLLGKVLQVILSSRISSLMKSGAILLTGYGVFVLTKMIREISHAHLPFEIFFEPLLLCMVGSFVVTNYSNYRSEFLQIMHNVGPPIYVAFFTLTGASLALDILPQTWPIALALFVIRLGAIFIGSFGGGVIAGDPMEHNRISWMAYVTQAGVGLGLAKEVAVEFPEWGTAFATMIISVIVLNQIVGPPLFKWAVNAVGEAHPRAKPMEFDGIPDAIIFGLEGQSLALARQLQAHGWQAKVASRKANYILGYLEELTGPDVEIYPISGITLDTLRELGADHTDAIVTMLSDEENHQICELAYEHFGTETLVVRLNDRANFDRFHELGALIVDPGTAIVSLLDHLVRSPSAASFVLGADENHDMVEIEVCNIDLHEVAVRDLRLPLDTLILSVHRNGSMLISHGYTQLELGDHVLVVGSPESLEQVMLRFGP